jgi:hypothetical protein
MEFESCSGNGYLFTILYLSFDGSMSAARIFTKGERVESFPREEVRISAYILTFYYLPP